MPDGHVRLGEWGSSSGAGSRSGRRALKTLPMQKSEHKSVLTFGVIKGDSNGQIYPLLVPHLKDKLFGPQPS